MKKLTKKTYLKYRKEMDKARKMSAIWRLAKEDELQDKQRYIEKYEARKLKKVS